MPMGIGVPPFYQTYEELLIDPPTFSPYYSFILNQSSEWIDHHKIAIDGTVLHRDARNPGLIHMCLLSYERHILVAHWVLPVEQDDSTAAVLLRKQLADGAGHSIPNSQAPDIQKRLAERIQFP